MENEQFRGKFQEEPLENFKESFTEIKVEPVFICVNQRQPSHICKQETFEENTIKTEHLNVPLSNVNCKEIQFEFCDLSNIKLESAINTENCSNSLSNINCKELKIEPSHLTKIKEEKDYDIDKYLVDNIIKSELLSEEYDVPIKSENEFSMCKEEAQGRCKQIKERKKCARKVGKKYKCQKCGKSFSSSSSRIIHEVSHSTSNLKICSFCDQVFITKLEFVHHLVTNHLVRRSSHQISVSNNHLKLQRKDKQVISSKVKNVSPSKDNIHEQQYISTDTEYVKCSSCGGVNCVCKNQMISYPSTSSFRCKICLKCFKLKGHLKGHMLIHTGQKSFQCEVCLKRFLRKFNLVKHMRTHTNEKRFKCQICLKDFNENYTLQNHIRLVHHNEKRYNCETCSKSFKHKISLIEHLHSHSDRPNEKLFLCVTCNKSFKHRRNLIRHSSSHNRIPVEKKLVNCVTCNKAFKSKSNLTRHMHLHTDQKLFKCEICLKAFKSKWGLKSHMRVHKENVIYNT